MKVTRKKYAADFKAKVALEALRGDKTVLDLAQHYEIHPTVIHEWKRQLTESAANAFKPDSKNEDQASQAKLDKLYRKIGQLEVERDFLASRPGLLELAKKMR